MNPLHFHLRGFLTFGLMVLLTAFGGCATFNPKNDDPAKLLQEAIQFIKVENFEDATKNLTKILEDFPDSPQRVTASLLTAEVAYKRGEYEEAKFKYQQFLELYPAHRLADRALFYKAMSDYQLMDIETRDQTYAQNALEEFNRLIKEFPKSKYRPKALVKKRHCVESLARNQMEIGKFYFRTSSFQSAIMRFQQLIKNYPDQPFLDEAIFLLAESYYMEQNYREAKIHYLGLLKKFPRSEHVTKAREKLRTIK
ncbi:MAG: outer membrane protein assembly factor BamD [Nitrospinaceae bacterium]|nr:outer membrane protein assembly factor BamD [Nitrospinaceae bacterium]NIR54314.1 outer membrane protein assembly factor BamD [Nitrospinaceae bacterium]NIS84732.1 outer membrane protein assembly factor BamD [Nitrospinaceae bacterium]NIT81533.1 outer membrane protein assembly factor BamD [Nitrospinaceae bacterium]NIU43818.1 outer membrane protein assembly factor BamD [Nitrospinaceae bacterium]